MLRMSNRRKKRVSAWADPKLGDVRSVWHANSAGSLSRSCRNRSHSLTSAGLAGPSANLFRAQRESYGTPQETRLGSLEAILRDRRLLCHRSPRADWPLEREQNHSRLHRQGDEASMPAVRARLDASAASLQARASVSWSSRAAFPVLFSTGRRVQAPATTLEMSSAVSAGASRSWFVSRSRRPSYFGSEHMTPSHSNSGSSSARAVRWGQRS